LAGNLSARTGCGPTYQVLLLMRASGGDGFGRMAAIRALLKAGRGGIKTRQNEEFERIRCKRIEKLRGRVPLSPA
jgi:hypothetical protein